MEAFEGIWTSLSHKEDPELYLAKWHHLSVIQGSQKGASLSGDIILLWLPSTWHLPLQLYVQNDAMTICPFLGFLDPFIRLKAMFLLLRRLMVNINIGVIVTLVQGPLVPNKHAPTIIWFKDHLCLSSVILLVWTGHQVEPSTLIPVIGEFEGVKTREIYTNESWAIT